MVDLLKSYFDIASGDEPQRSAEKVLGKVLMLDETLKPILLALLDLPVEDRAWQTLDPPQRRRRTLDGLKALLVRESQRQPVALVLEDLHWIDGETQGLLDSLVESLSTCRILLLVNYRPEYRHGWGGRAHYTQLRIDRLQAAGAEELLGGLLGDAPELTELKQRLLAASDGNPLFFEESVRNLADAGVLSGVRGAYRLVRRPDQIEVPASVTAIIAARVDRLDAAEKSALQLAAVIGEDVPLALLEAVSDLPVEEFHGAMADLRAREFLYEARLFPEIAYAFRHGLTRRVAYEGVLHESRRALHERVAAALEARHADQLDQVIDLLAHRFEQGAVQPKAAEYLLRAAERAKQRYAYPTALELARRAEEIATRDPDLAMSRWQALELQGDLHSLTGELEIANRAYEAAIALVEATERRRIERKLHRPCVAVRDGARIAYYLHGAGGETLLERLAQRITTMSGGQLEVKVFAAGELVPAFESFDAVSSGNAEMSHSVSYYWQGKSPAFNFFTAVPFGLTATEHVAWITYGGGQELWDEVAAQFEIKPFLRASTGVQMGGWFNKEIKALDDYQGLKFRMPGLGGEVLRRLGVAVINLPVGEIFPALQAGTIDGTEWVGPWHDMAAGFYKVAKFYYWPGWHEPGTTGEVMVNLAAWEGLSEEHKAIVRAAVGAEAWQEFADAHKADALTQLIDTHGVQLRRYSDDLLIQVARVAEDVVAEIGESDELTGKVYKSYLAFRRKAVGCARLSDQGYLAARALLFA